MEGNLRYGDSIPLLLKPIHKSLQARLTEADGFSRAYIVFYNLV